MLNASANNLRALKSFNYRTLFAAAPRLTRQYYRGMAKYDKKKLLMLCVLRLYIYAKSSWYTSVPTLKYFVCTQSEAVVVVYIQSNHFSGKFTEKRHRSGKGVRGWQSGIIYIYNGWHTRKLNCNNLHYAIFKGQTHFEVLLLHATKTYFIINGVYTHIFI